MPTKITLFNHKGGVGKTTLTINVSDALADLGHTVLIVDADPQCNLTAFYLEERKLDEILQETQDDEGGGTIWSAIRPVVRGKGGVQAIEPIEVGNNQFLAPGDVLLSDYEEELPAAWTDAFARKERGYDVMCALSKASTELAASVEADVVLLDVGPNVGPLNRAVLLDSDYFITPVAADLFSLRALSTVGRSLVRWMTDWKTVVDIAPAREKSRLIAGRPAYMGYITSAFKVSTGMRKALPHSHWEAKIAPRVKTRIVDLMKTLDPSLVPKSSNKIGDVKHFHSLAAAAQEHGTAIGNLRGQVNSGHYAQVDEAKLEFAALAREIASRSGI